MKPIGVQLYSLREDSAKSFIDVLKFVAKVGYKYVEPAGLWDIRPRDFRKVISDLGLDMISSHTPWARDCRSLGEVMDTADALGLDKIVCGYGPANFENLDKIRQTAENTNKMQEILERNGFTLFQHNHDFEFQRFEDGRLKYEIYREMCPKVKYQLDCFWSTSLGKENAVEMLDLFAKDTILIHMKDGETRQKVSGDKMVNGFLEREVDMRPLGDGSLPIKELVARAPEQVQAIIVELDFCNIDMKTAIEKSYRYMIDNKLAVGNVK